MMNEKKSEITSLTIKNGERSLTQEIRKINHVDMRSIFL